MLKEKNKTHALKAKKKKTLPKKMLAKTQGFISLMEAAGLCTYSQEYLSLLVRKKLLQGEKIGRNWFTKKEWLEKYIREHPIEKTGNVKGVLIQEKEITEKIVEAKVNQDLKTLWQGLAVKREAKPLLKKEGAFLFLKKISREALYNVINIIKSVTGFFVKLQIVAKTKNVFHRVAEALPVFFSWRGVSWQKIFEKAIIMSVIFSLLLTSAGAQFMAADFLPVVDSLEKVAEKNNAAVMASAKFVDQKLGAGKIFDKAVDASENFLAMTNYAVKEMGGEFKDNNNFLVQEMNQQQNGQVAGAQENLAMVEKENDSTKVQATTLNQQQEQALRFKAGAVEPTSADGLNQQKISVWKKVFEETKNNFVKIVESVNGVNLNQQQEQALRFKAGAIEPTSALRFNPPAGGGAIEPTSAGAIEPTFKAVDLLKEKVLTYVGLPKKSDKILSGVVLGASDWKEKSELGFLGFLGRLGNFGEKVTKNFLAKNNDNISPAQKTVAGIFGVTKEISDFVYQNIFNPVANLGDTLGGSVVRLARNIGDDLGGWQTNWLDREMQNQNLIAELIKRDKGYDGSIRQLAEELLNQQENGENGFSTQEIVREIKTSVNEKIIIVKGEKGDKGETGEKGEKGERGEAGSAGTDGQNGSTNSGNTIVTNIYQVGTPGTTAGNGAGTVFDAKYLGASELAVSGNTKLNTLTVSGAADFGSAVNIAGNLSLTGSGIAGGNFTTAGNITAGGYLQMGSGTPDWTLNNGSAYFASNVETDGSVKIDGATSTVPALWITSNPVAVNNLALLNFGANNLVNGSSQGTIIGANLENFTGNIFDFQVNDVSKFKIDSAGNILRAGSATYAGTVLIESTTTPQLIVRNEANNLWQSTVDNNGNAIFALQAGSGVPEFSFNNPVNINLATATSVDILNLTASTTAGVLKIVASSTEPLITLNQKGAGGGIVFLNNVQNNSRAALLQYTDNPLNFGAANGTFIGANPQSFSGNWLDFQVAGTRYFSLATDGDIFSAGGALMTTNSSTALSVQDSLGNTHFVVDTISGKYGFATSTPNRDYGLTIATSTLQYGDWTLIGNATTTGSLTGGSLAIGGDVTLGDSGTDRVVFNGYVMSDIVPADNARSLGSSVNRWNYGYFDSINVNELNAGGTNISGTASNEIVINSSNASDDTEDASLVFERGTPVTNAAMRWDASENNINFNFPIWVEGTDTTGQASSTITVKAGINQGNYNLFQIKDVSGNNLVQADPVGHFAIGSSYQNGYGVTIATSTYFVGDAIFANGSTFNSITTTDSAYIGGKLQVVSTTTIGSNALVVRGGDGKVGIGTGSPTGKLTIQTATGTASVLTLKDANGTDAIEFRTGYNSSYNIFIGNDAGDEIQSEGLRNIALGEEALTRLTTGDNNVGIGYQAMNNLLSGDSNYALGYQANNQLTTGSYNFAIGTLALSNNQTGSSNLAIGHGAGYNTSGVVNRSFSTYLGANAGRELTGSWNTFIGANTGYVDSTVADGGYNLFIGYDVGDNVAAGADSNILIGRELDLQVAGGDDQLSIGNILFGIGVDGTGTTISTGNIGIATTTPYAKLSVVSDDYNLPKFMVASSTGFSTPSLYVTSNGNVGVGTGSPSSALHVYGTTDSSSSLTVDRSASIYGPSIIFSENGTERWRIQKDYDGSDANKFQIISGSSAKLTITSTGNVGIGTTSPQALLSLGSAVTAQKLLMYDSGFVRYGFGIQSGEMRMFSPNSAVLTFGSVNAGDGSTWDEKMRISMVTGNVGIATTTPYAKLSVVSDDYNLPKFMVASSTGFSTPSLYVASNGNVGVGTGSPTHQFSVGNKFMVTINGSVFIPSGQGIGIDPNSGGANSNIYFNTGVIAVGGTTDFNHINANFIIKNGGNVGIANTNPQYKLDVAGDINLNATSSIYMNGLRVLNASSTTYSVSVGTDAGQNLNDKGLYNVFVGYEAGHNTTSTDQNIGIGYRALYAANDSGINNQAIGYSALRNNTVGYSNNAMGLNSLYDNIGGDYNNAFGDSALTNNTEGNENNAFGYNTMFTNTTGSYNNALGRASMFYNTTGLGNNAIGYYTLLYNSTGNYNNAIGYEASRNNSSATSTVALGAFTAKGNAGAFNAGEYTAIGAYSLYNIQTGAEDNTALGYRAGYNVTTGANNILLGYQAGESLTTGSKNIVIGYDIDTPAVDSANTLNIGNILFGTGLTGSGTTIAGRIGIATSTPWRSDTWDYGTVVATTTMITGTTTIGTNNALVVNTNSGYVGVGTMNPAVRLQVTKTNSSNGHIAIFERNDSAVQLAIGYDSTTENKIYFDTPTGHDIEFRTSGTSKMRIDNTSGNIGINTTTPYAKFSVVSDDYNLPKFMVASSTGFATPSLYVASNGYVGIGTASPGSKLDITVANQTPGFRAIGGSGELRITPYFDANYGTLVYAMNLAETDYVPMTFSASKFYFKVGSIGINNINPQYALDVAGSLNLNSTSTAYMQGHAVIGSSTLQNGYGFTIATSTYFTNDTVFAGGSTFNSITTTDSAYIGGKMQIVSTTTIGSNALVVRGGDGKVGIGTATPGAKLHIYDSSVNVESKVEMGGSGYAINRYINTNGSLIIGKNNLAGSALFSLDGISYSGGIGTTNSSPLQFGVNNNAYLNIINGGNVGIATTTPYAKLSVVSDDYNLPKFMVASSTGFSTPSLYVASNGNVGVKTNNPQVSMHIVKTGGSFSAVNASTLLLLENSSATYMTFLSANTTNAGIMFGDTDSTNRGGIFYDHGNSLGGGTADSLNFKTAGTFGRMVIDASGYVGIATTTPYAKLSVVSDDYNFPKFMVASSTGFTTPSLYVASNGNVGVGTNDPTNKLTVAVPNSTVGIVLKNTSGNGWLGLYMNSSGTPDLRITNSSSQQTVIISGNSGDSSFINAGNFGIANSNPQFKLDVAGSLNLNSTSTAYMQGHAVIGSSTLQNGYGLTIATSTYFTNDTIFAGGSTFNSITTTDSAYIGGKLQVVGTTTIGSANTLVVNTNEERVGIGTATPTSTLAVAGTFNVQGQTNNSSYLYVNSSGNVGIGTNNPLEKFSVNGIAKFENSTAAGMQFIRRSSNAGDQSRIQFIIDSSSNAERTSIGAVRKSDGSHDMLLNIYNGSVTEAMRWAATGNIGIATTTPYAKLSVVSDDYNLPKFMVASSTGFSTPALYVASNGNVGVGTNNPSQKLDVVGTIGATTVTANTVISVNTTGFQLNGSYTKLYGTNNGINSSSMWQFNLGGNETFRIQSAANNVNYHEFDGSATGNSLQWIAGGTDTNINMAIIPKGLGNVGIATTTPYAKLSVVSDDYNLPKFMVASSTGFATPALYVASNGNVGVGTNNPTAILDVYSATNRPIYLRSGTVYTDAFAGYTYGGGMTFGSAVTSFDSGLNKPIIFQTNVSGVGTLEWIRLTNSGNLGIANTNPQYKLDVSGSLNLNSTSTLFAGGRLAVSTSTPYENYGVAIATSTIIIADSYTQPKFVVASSTGSATPSIYVRSDGGVGIGTTSGGSKLSVRGMVGIGNSSDSLLIYNDGNDSYIQEQTRDMFFYSSASNYLVFKKTTKNAGFGAGAYPTAKFEIGKGEGFVGPLFRVASSTNNYFEVTSEGSVGVATTTPYAKLSVVSDDYNLPKFMVASSTGFSTPSLYVASNGNVGVGTGSPGSTLPSGLSPTKIFEISGSNVTSILLRRADNATGLDITQEGNASGNIYFDSRYNDAVGGFRFRTRTAGTPINAMTILGSGNVGIGTTTPYSALTVVNDSYTLPKFMVASSTGFSTPSLYVASNGNVGVGTRSPSALLQVGGSVNADRYMTVDASGRMILRYGDNSIGDVLTLANAYNGTGGVNNGNGILFGSPHSSSTNNSGRIVVASEQAWSATASTNDSYMAFSTTLNGTLTERVRINSDGNVGIGTTAPGTLNTVSFLPTNYGGLHVYSSQEGRLLLEGSAGARILMNDPSEAVDDRLLSMRLVDGNLNFQGLQDDGDVDTNLFSLDISTGNVGIGTTTPYSALTVVNDSYTAPKFMVASSTGFNTPSLYVASNGNVGVGTNNPQFLLHAYSSSAVDTALYFDSLSSNTNIAAAADTSVKVPQIWLSDRTLTSSPYTATVGNAGMFLDRTTALYANRNDFILANLIQDKDIHFVTNDNNSKTIKLTIKDGGNVGIATTTPYAKLSVVSDDYNLPKFMVASSTGFATPSLYVASNGNVGVGTNNPGTLKLYVNGNTQVNGQLVVNILSGNAGSDLKFGVYSGTEQMRLTTAGNVGIANTNPQFKLDVAGDLNLNSTSTAYMQGHAVIGSSSLQDGYGFTIATSTYFTNDTVFAGGSTFNSITTTDSAYIGGKMQIVSTTTIGSNALVVRGGDGNVGIGTASPYSLLDIGGGALVNAGISVRANIASNANSIQTFQLQNTSAGTGAEMRFITAADDRSYLAFTQPSSANTSEALFGLTKGLNSFIFNTSGDAGAEARNIVIGTTNNKNLYFGTNNTVKMTILGSGNVGIATTTPYAKLSVVSDDYNLPKFMVASSTGFSTPSLYVASNGNVGVGTTGPTATLDVNGMVRATGNVNPTSGAGVEVMYSAGEGYITAYDRTTPGYKPLRLRGDDLIFQEGGTEIMRIATGNVGIATTNPQYKLDVAGDINLNATSSIYMNGLRVLNASSTTRSLFAGTQAGNSSNELATDNVFLGYQAGYRNATGSANVFIGEQAGYTGTSTINNTAVGYQALNKAIKSESVGGSYNTALGYMSLYSNTTGYYNNAAGTYALYFNTTGQENNAQGYAALYKNTTGSQNTAVGLQSLLNNTIGSYNSTLGREALRNNITGNNNSALGINASFYNTSATSTVSIGAYAGRGNPGGYNAGEYTALGAYTLYNIQTGAENNTAIGYRSGYAIETGANNVLLGYQSGESLTTGSNNIVIGYDIDTPTSSSANTLNIGNLLYGNGVDGANTTLSTGNIGIATTTPYAKLSVVSDTAELPKFMVASSTSFTTPSLYVASDGNVGIGTNNPTDKLTIAAGHVKVDSNYGLISSSLNAVRFVPYDSSTNMGLTAYNDIWFKTYSGGTYNEKARITQSGNLGIATTTPYAKLSVVSDDYNLPKFMVASSTGFSTPSLYVASNGRVGVGTGAPAVNLHINSASASPEFRITSQTNNTFDPGIRLSYVGVESTQATHIWYSVANGTTYFDNLYNNDNGDIRFRTKAAGTPNDILTLTGDGNVGIANTNPQYKLDVAGSLNLNSTSTAYMQGHAVIGSSTLQNGYGFTVATSTYIVADSYTLPKFVVASSTGASTPAIYVASNGRVGIGTDTPLEKLNISAGHIQLDNGYAVRSKTTGGTIADMINIYTDNNFYLGPGTTINDFYFRNGSIQMVLQGSTGNLGIGNNNPQYKLDVSGSLNLNSTSTLFAGGRLAVSTSTPYENYGVAFATSTIIISDSYTLPKFVVASSTGAATPALYVASNGKVGINTNNPSSSYALTVDGGADVKSGYLNLGTNQYLYWATGNAGIKESNYNLKFETWTGAALTEKMRITGGGNIGIRNSNPQYALDVAGSLNLNSTSTLFANGKLLVNTTTAFGVDIGQGYGATLATSTLITGTTTIGMASALMVNTNENKVGVGTANPMGILDVAGTTPVVIVRESTSNNGKSYIRLSETATTWQGAFIQYDGLANRLNLGMHVGNDTLTSGDAVALSIDRTTTYTGIGNNNPAYRLDVSGGANFKATSTEQLRLSNAETGDKNATFTVDNTGNMTVDLNTDNATTTFSDNVSIANGKNLQVSNLIGYSPIKVWTNLEIYGNATATSFYTNDLVVEGAISGTGLDNSFNDLLNATTTLDLITLDTVNLTVVNATTTGSLYVGSDNLVVMEGGNVGIGTANPQVALHVVGEMRAYDVGGAYISFSHDGTNGIISASSGNIEIGTAGNDVYLGAVGSAANLVFEESAAILGQGNNVISLGQSGDRFNLAVSGAEYWFKNIQSTSTNLYLYASSTEETIVVLENPADNKPVRLFVEGAITVASSSDTLNPTVYNYNNFGGGTPGQAAIATSGDVYIRGDIEVDGVAYLTGGTAWTQGDLAENMAVRALSLEEISNENIETTTSTVEEITTLPEEGDVLMMDEQNEWTAVKSFEKNSNRILGVVSTDPAGVMRGDLGRADNSVRPVALSGTVPVKVSLENGPIHKGDLLTTASRAGYAMKATNMGAGIIGMAMEDYLSEEILDNTSTVVDLIENSLTAKENERLERQAEENDLQEVGTVEGLETAETSGMKAGKKILVMIGVKNNVVREYAETTIKVIDNPSLNQKVTLENYEFKGNVVVEDLVVSGKIVVMGAAEFMSEVTMKGNLNLEGAITRTYLEKKNEGLLLGDAVYIAGDNLVARANADLLENNTFHPAIGLVVEIAEGQKEATEESQQLRSVKVAIGGTVKGLSGLEAGTVYYLADINYQINASSYAPGNLTATSTEDLEAITSLMPTKPQVYGGYIQSIAVAESANSLLLMPSLNFSEYSGEENEAGTAMNYTYSPIYVENINLPASNEVSGENVEQIEANAGENLSGTEGTEVQGTPSVDGLNQQETGLVAGEATEPTVEQNVVVSEEPVGE